MRRLLARDNTPPTQLVITLATVVYRSRRKITMSPLSGQEVKEVLGDMR
jgi:hypothetical protein